MLCCKGINSKFKNSSSCKEWCSNMYVVYFENFEYVTRISLRGTITALIRTHEKIFLILSPFMPETIVNKFYIL